MTEFKKSRLKDFRIKEGITISDLAKKANVSPKTINRAEVFDNPPKEVTLYKILKAFNELSKKRIEIDQIFY